MYLTKDANAATLRQIAALAAGSTLAMTFLLPLELAAPEMRPSLEFAAKGGARKRDAVYHLLHAGGDADAGPRCRFQGGPARACGHASRALLRRQNGWTAAVKLEGSAGGDDLWTEVLTGCGSDPPALLRYAPGLAADSALWAAALGGERTFDGRRAPSGTVGSGVEIKTFVHRLNSHSMRLIADLRMV